MVVILLSHDTNEEVNVPSTRVDSLLPYGSISAVSFLSL
jgi:hypothetical protein